MIRGEKAEEEINLLFEILAALTNRPHPFYLDFCQLYVKL